MASALGGQLGRLAAAKAADDRAATGVAGGRASLLYTAAQAADVDLTAISSIGLSGFKQLVKLEKRFAQFEKTLFNAAALNVDRSSMTADAIAKLDSALESFLRLLCPYYLSPPAFQALELLIRRFKIHLHNVDALILCGLPYHSTQEFVRLVQICHLEPGSTWEFLRGMKATGAPMPRSALASRLVKDPALFRVVANMGSDKGTSSRACTFQAVVLCEALAQLRSIEEDTVSMLAPHILAGMEAAAAQDRRASAYMITGALSARVAFSAELLDTLLVRACRISASEQVPQTLLLLVALAKTQQGLSRLPDAAFKLLVKQPDLGLHISRLASKGDREMLAPLLHLLLPPLATSAVTAHVNYAATLEEVMRLLPPDVLRPHATPVAKRLLEFVCAPGDGSALVVEGERAEVLSRLIRLMDTRTPEELDAVVNKALGAQAKATRKALKAAAKEAKQTGVQTDAGKKEEERLKQSTDFLQRALHGSIRAPMSTSGASLAAAVYSQVPAVRASALHLLDQACNAKDAAADAEAFAQSVALQSLGDDSPEVVRAALGLKCLLRSPAEATLQAASEALNKCRVGLTGNSPEASGEAAQEILEWLCGDFTKSNSSKKTGEQVAALLAEFLLLPPSAAEVQKCATRLAAQSSNAFLAALKGAKGKKSSSLDCLAKALSQQEGALEAARSLASAGSNGSRQLVMAALSQAVCTDSFAGPAAELVRMATDLLATAGTAFSNVIELQSDGTPGPDCLVRLLAESEAATRALARGALLAACSKMSYSTWGEVEAALTSGNQREEKGAITLTALCRILSAVAAQNFGGGGSVAEPSQEQLRLPRALLETALPAESRALWMARAAAGNSGLLCAAGQHMVLEVLGATLAELACAAAEGNTKAAIRDAKAKAEALRLGSLLPSLITACTHSDTAVRRVAGKVATALWSLVKSAGEDVLSGGEEGQGSGLSSVQMAAVLAMLKREAAGIERDPIALENALRVALRGGTAEGKKKKQHQESTELGPKGTEALQAFLLRQLSGCLGSEGPAVGQLALRCLRGAATPKQLLSAAVSCLEQMPEAGTAALPAAIAVREVELGAELIAEFDSGAVQEAKSAAIIAQCLQVLLLPARLPPSHADLRAAAASACTPEVMELAREAAPEAHGELLQALMKMAAGDLHAACRTAAREALGALEVCSADLLLLLQGAGRGAARSSKRTKGAAGNAKAPATAEPSEHTLMVLELLQWKSGVVRAMDLVPVLAALLAGQVGELDKPKPQAAAAPDSAASISKSGVTMEYEALFGVDADDNGDDPTDGEGSAGAGDGAYLRQLLLLTLALLLEEAEGQGGQAELVDVSVVVRVAQLTHDPAERSSALRLLGQLAVTAPEGTLKNVLEVVNTAKTAAAGDSEAWSLATVTLAAVVPAWIASGRGLEELLQGTVEMLPDLDPPRRAPLLQAILGSIPQDGEDSDRALELVLLMLLRQVVKARQQPSEPDTHMAAAAPQGFDDFIWLADLAGSLAKAAEPVARLQAFGGLLACLPGVTLASDKPKPSRSLQRLLVTFVTEQLQHMKLQSGVQVEDSAMLGVLRAGLAAVQALGRQLPDIGAGKKKTALEALIDSICTCVAALEGLVDTPAYISALVSLASSGGSSADTNSRSLRLLAEKVASVAREAAELREDGAETSATRAEFVAAAKASIGLCSPECQALLGTDTAPATQQSYLTALGTVAEAFGQLRPKEVLQAAPAVIGALSAESPVAVRGTSLITLGHMARGLEARLVPLLPSLLGPLVATLSANVEVLAKSSDAAGSNSESDGDELSTEDVAIEAGAVMATVSALLDGPLAPFLARNMSELLPLLLHPAVLAAQGTLPEQARACRSLMAERIPPRLLLAGLASMLEGTLSRGQGPVEALVEIMEEAVGHLDSAAAALHAEEVFTFLLKCMDIRRQRLPGFPDQDMLDATVMRGLVALVMKLSEARFKPLFLRLMEWASSTPEEASGGSAARTLMLFSAAEALGTRLRSVFVPYFTYLLDAAVGSLKLQADQPAGTEPAVAPPSAKKRKKGSQQATPVSADITPEMEVEGWLLKYKVVSALHVCFEHDSVAFLEPERFSRLLPMIAAQIDVAPSHMAMVVITAAAKASGQVHGPTGAASSAIGTLGWAVVDCLTSMAIASGSDEHWRPLNHAVLMSTRSDSARTKLTALEVVASLVKRLAEEYLTLLPEAIPFLAELLEDPNQDVESRAQELVKELEGLAGESLDPFMKAG